MVNESFTAASFAGLILPQAPSCPPRLQAKLLKTLK
jgi:hypothetical protein